MIVLRGGRVLTAGGWVEADVTIERDRISHIGGRSRGATELDATGCLVGPGFVDLHTHLREPGQTWKEDVASASAAAAAGGFTAVVAMPNTQPPLDTPGMVSLVADRGVAVGLNQVVPAAALTLGRSGEVPVDVAELYEAGVRIFSDDGDSVGDAGVLRRVMKAVADLPYGVVAQHAEDANRTAGGHLHDGELARRLGIGGLPAAAETDVVARDLELVAETGVRYHCQHVSAEATVDLIRQAKRDGLKVTAEVTPHHLSFDERDVANLDTNFKMYPPLRSPADRAALVEGLRDGTIDVVATDHAPHSPAEKDVTFAQAPRGVIGLETAASAVWQVLGHEDRLFQVLSRAPAGIAGLDDQGAPLHVGGPANVVLFDPGAEWVPSTFVSKSSNSPYRGRPLPGVVRATIYRGRIVHQTGVRTV
ncbi:MAG: dihydroorotase [Acidimicrobiia bacterium]|jgi:dihydroorotase